jgi:hypothetical protein
MRYGMASPGRDSSVTAKYLSPAEISAKLGLNQDRVRLLCRQGHFPGAYKYPDNGNWLIPADLISSDKTRSYQGENKEGYRAANIEQSGDITIGDVSNSTMAVGSGAQVNITQGPELKQINILFDQIYDRIDARREDADVDKQEISETVQKIQTEVVKSDQTNVKRVEQWLKTLALMAPDIFEVTVATLTNPLTGLGTVIRKIAEKARIEYGESN